MSGDPTKDPKVDPGGAGGQGGTGDPKPDPKPGDPGSGSGDPKPKGGDPGQQYVTATVLTSVLDSHKRTVSGELKKTQDSIASLQSGIDEMKKALVAGKGDGDDGKGGKPKSEAEQKIISMQRQVDELTTKLKEADDRASLAEDQRKNAEFKATVTKALIDSGCEKPEEAYLVIKPRLQTDEVDGKIFAAVKSQTYGEETLDLKTYIEREFRENVLPHVFKGKMRTGSPAGGDPGSGGRSYEFTKEQVFDPKTYMDDPDKARAAIEGDRVKGLKRSEATAGK